MFLVVAIWFVTKFGEGQIKRYLEENVPLKRHLVAEVVQCGEGDLDVPRRETLETLSEAIREEWENIPQDFINNLVDTLPNRCQEVRGITPPHRVKSISMATFTNDEIDLLKSRGNDHCRRVWLGLYEGAPPAASGDDQAVRDFMVEKYERRCYDLTRGSAGLEAVPAARPLTQLVSDPKPIKINGANGRCRPPTRTARDRKADIFSGAQRGTVISRGAQQNGGTSFANFDNNPVFSNTSTNTTTTAVGNMAEKCSVFKKSPE
ncbi:hypothetical protein NQ318_019534 [Aromia moschata]|uniref:Arf-GAP domain-containing protein n=1 Tax=Aromia moschata TaxID=1265417 RepID=A0AAV8XHC3_9CUCU|nr:hypothetical protein NQ318_019534 [Aromia moschata]